MILLLTEGGILLLAMQRYAPICSREMSWRGDHGDGGGDDDGNDGEDDDEIDTWC